MFLRELKIKVKGKQFLTTWDKIKVKQDYEYLVCVVLDKLWHLSDKVTDSGKKY